VVACELTVAALKTKERRIIRNFFMADHVEMRLIVQAVGLTKQVSTGNELLTILDNINLEINAGDSVAVVGASGSGKSTLLGLLAGLDTPSAGKVHLDGEDIFSLDEDARAALRGRVLGFVFQSFQLLPALTAIENVMLPLELVGASDAHGAALELLERVGLGMRLKHYPRQLSGGEQQRVAIARAFVTQPQLLLADEPTGNLDPATSVGIMNVLDRINQNGTTVLMATHDDDIVNSMRRRVIELDAGKVIRDEAVGEYTTMIPIINADGTRELQPAAQPAGGQAIAPFDTEEDDL
jgi:putative ABC transport system ATP-binding protein